MALHVVHFTLTMRSHQHFHMMPVKAVLLHADMSDSCLQIILPARDCMMQEVLDLVAVSAADFDAVCMATALHKMASLDADPQQYKLLGDRPELTRLKDMICEPSTLFMLQCT